ncbi:hypothetical protein EDB89DRAFT_2035880 [Lactarius sanguifluus]|nr:hypothetical protein EDB89DRAFT_2035880 [Lactarius sanguifluus]
MLSPLRLPSLSTPATPPSTPTLTQSSRSPASRASIRQITRTVTEDATVWSPAVAMPITPRKGPPGPLWVTLSKARRTPDTPRKGPHHATFAYGLPSPISPPTRRLRPSAVRISRLPIPPFAVSTPPRRANPASLTPSSECYLVTPTSGREIQYPRPRPRSPLSRNSSSIELDIVKNQCNEQEPLLSAFRGVSFSLSPSCSFYSIDNGLESLLSSTVLPAVPLFSTTSPLAKMVQQAREERSIGNGKLSQPTVGVQSVSDVASLRVAQTTRAPVVEPQVVQVEQWPEVLPGCIGSRGLQVVGAHPSSDGHGDDAARSSEPASGHTLVRARPMTRQANERVNRPQSTPPAPLRLPADSLSVPTGIGQKFMPLMRTRSVLSRITGKAKVVSTSATNATGEDSLVRSTGKRCETRLPQLRSMRNLFRRI